MDSRYPGVRPRGNSIVIDFTFKGQRFRETLKVKPNKSTLREASRKREAILYEISMGNFNYKNHFPNSSKSCNLFAFDSPQSNIKQLLKKWLKYSEKRCEKSTIRDYASIIHHHLIPAFGHYRVTELTAGEVEEWCYSLNCSAKRINNILIPLRQVFKDTFYNGLIDRDPMLRVKSFKVSYPEPNPFSSKEIELILDQLADQERNLIQFAFWSGLRTSELIALRWKDIDFENSRFYVRVARVRNHEKSTKTSSGIRTIALHDQSKIALLNQIKHTKQSLIVFHDPKNDAPWASDQPVRKRVWMPALKAAGIEYRNPYQTRHTFASMMLSRNILTPFELAYQMGHKDWGMIRKVYARWIPN